MARRAQGPVAKDAPLAVVTGASRGLGRCFAHKLAARGHHLMLAARDAAALDAIAVELRAAHGVEVICVAADLAERAGVAALLASARGRAIDLFINNAGCGLGRSFAEEDGDRIAAMLQLNVVSATALLHGLLPALRASRGSIVQVASFAGFVPVPYMAAYAASKAYALHLAEALAEELAADGVHVLALCPGAVATDFWRRADIALANTRMAPTTSEVVVDAALRGLARRQRIVVPLAGQRSALFGARFMPRRWLTKLGAKLVDRRR